MRLLPDPRHGRVLALILLAIVLMLGYLAGLHWWFVSPLADARAQMIELRDEEARFRAVAQQRDSVLEALSRVREFEHNNPGFLTESNFDLAASALIQRLQEQIDALDAGEQCTLVSRTPFRERNTDRSRSSREREAETPAFEKVTIKVRMLCEMEFFGPLLHGLESGSPQLFVSDLVVSSRARSNVRSRRGAATPVISSTDEAFDLYGYLRRDPAGGQ